MDTDVSTTLHIKQHFRAALFILGQLPDTATASQPTNSIPMIACSPFLQENVTEMYKSDKVTCKYDHYTETKSTEENVFRMIRLPFLSMPINTGGVQEESHTSQLQNTSSSHHFYIRLSMVLLCSLILGPMVYFQQSCWINPSKIQARSHCCPKSLWP